MDADRENVEHSMNKSVRIGISGWRYPPWRDSFYPKDLRQADELAFAAKLFQTIEINGTFYSLKTPKNFENWASDTPDDFVFGLKVTDGPKLDRFGDLAGKPNENFLNADMFVKAFLKPCEAVRHAIGLLMF